MHPNVRIALLRGINVSGQKLIKMAHLREVMQEAGFGKVQTYIQSGNLVFSSPLSTAHLQEQIQEFLRSTYGWDIPTCVCTGEELEHIAQEHPFLHEAPNNLCFVHFLPSPPTEKQWAALTLDGYAPEQAAFKCGVIYSVHPNGSAKAHLGQNFWEKTLKTKATARNWNTVQALLKLAQAQEG